MSIRDVQHERLRFNPPAADQKFWDGFEFGAGMSDRYNFIDLCFNNYIASQWTVTNTQSVTEIVAATGDGYLSLPNVGDTENDITLLQLGGATSEPFSAVAGKKIWFGVTLKCDEATQVDLIAGLTDVDTGIPAAQPSGGMFFWKGDGSTNLDFYSIGSATSSETGLLTFAASTEYKCQMRVTGQSKVEYWVNDVYYGSLDSNIPTEALTISVGMADGDGLGGADTLSVRNVYCYQER